MDPPAPDLSNTCAAPTTQPEAPPSSGRSASPSTSLECISWLVAPDILASINPLPEDHRIVPSPHRAPSSFAPHADYRRCEGLRRDTLLRAACHAVPDSAMRAFATAEKAAARRGLSRLPWPPGATGVLSWPPAPRPGARGLQIVGRDVPYDYRGRKTVWSDVEWFVPRRTRMEREVWTADERVDGGIRVDWGGGFESVFEEDGGEEAEGEGGAGKRIGGKEEGASRDRDDVNGVDKADEDWEDEDDFELPGLSFKLQDFYGLKRDYDGYVSDGDSDTDSDSDDEDGDSGDDEKSGECGDNTRAFGNFDGDHTGDGEPEPAEE